MKKTFFLLIILVVVFTSLKAQNLPFKVAETSLFKELIASGNSPTNIQFVCEYEIDEKNTQWADIPMKERKTIIENSIFKIFHGSEFTECRLQYSGKALTTFTQNSSGQSFLIYHGDTVVYKANFNLSMVNEAGQDNTSESCSQDKYDFEGFNCFCHRFIGRNVNHSEQCMASENFPAVNTIFNLYYGFNKPKYFPVTFTLTIEGKNIAYKLKSIDFEAIAGDTIPQMDAYPEYREISFMEFFFRTPELR